MADVVGPGAAAGGRRSLRLLQLTAFTSSLDRFAMAPMLVAISRDLHLTLADVVPAASAYYLAYGLMQPVWGLASDRIGLVRMMRATLLAAAAATTLAALAPSIGWLTASRALAGAAFSAAIPASLVYVGDTVAADRRQREVTDLMAGVALGTAIATAGAGILAGTVGWRWPFVVTGLLALGLAGALRSLRPPTHARAGRPALAPLREVLTDRMALLVLVLAFTEGAVLLGAITFLPPAVEDTGVGPSVAGLVTGIYGVAVLVGATVTGRLSRRVPPARLIAAGATAAVAGCTVAAVSTSPAPALLACTLLGIAWASMHSTLQTWATDVVPSARATAVSLFAGSLFAGSAASAALAAGPASQGRWTVIFLFGALLTVPLGVVGSVARSGWHTAQTRRTA